MPLPINHCEKCGAKVENDVLCLECDTAENREYLEPFKTRRRQKIKKASQKQERRIMAGIGGRVQPASGARPGYKSDGRKYGELRIEAKFTYANSYRLTLVDLNKLRSECEGPESPALVLDFKEKATGRTTDSWVVIPHAEWERIINRKG